jgi:hypothetical protein
VNKAGLFSLAFLCATAKPNGFYIRPPRFFIIFLSHSFQYNNLKLSVKAAPERQCRSFAAKG